MSRCRRGHLLTGANVKLVHRWDKRMGKHYEFRRCMTCARWNNANHDEKRRLERGETARKHQKSPIQAQDFAFLESQRTAALQELEDRLQGCGYPTPMPWEKAEIRAKMAELRG